MKTISPAAEFRAGPDGVRFAEIVADPVFQAGLRVALLQFAFDQPRAAQWEPAARQHYAQEGARDFALCLLNLVEAGEKPAARPTQNLTWKQPQPQRQAPPPPRQPKA